MTRLPLALLLLLLACKGDDCPEGTVLSGAACIPAVDAGDTGRVDAGDAGVPDAPEGDSGEPACSPACAAPTPVCDIATSTCVGCRTEADCGGDTPYCVDTGVDGNTCVACRDAMDCDASAPACVFRPK